MPMIPGTVVDRRLQPTAVPPVRRRGTSARSAGTRADPRRVQLDAALRARCSAGATTRRSRRSPRRARRTRPRAPPGSRRRTARAASSAKSTSVPRTQWFSVAASQPTAAPIATPSADDAREAEADRAHLEHARQHDDGREPDAEQPRRVVHQALAAEDRGGAPRHAQPLEHRLNRDGVGRRDDRAEQEAGGPRQLRASPSARRPRPRRS